MTISLNSASGGFQLRSVLAYNFLLALGIITFSFGLLRPIPQVPVSSQASFHEDSVVSPPEARFDRVIFMVIDALRRYLIASQVFSYIWTTDHRAVILFFPTHPGSASHRGMLKMTTEMADLETVLLIVLGKVSFAPATRSHLPAMPTLPVSRSQGSSP